MQVGKSEVLCRAHHYGVGVWNVYAALYDGGGDEHVIVVVHKAQDYLLQFLWRHLSVSYCHPGIGHILAHYALQFRQGGYAVRHDVGLSVSAHLEAHGLGNNIAREGAHLCLYGVSVGWGSLYHAQVPGTHKRELQCARYRSGGQCQRVHVGLHLAKLLLGGDAELLLLVYYQQAQVLELHSLSYQPVRAYDDVYLAILQVGEQFPGVLCRAGT